jgi:hypothetical protein
MNNMNDVKGMSLSDFNAVIEEMRGIYPFKNNKTYLSNLRDMISNSQRRVEIITTDEKTGVNIVLSKGV